MASGAPFAGRPGAGFPWNQPSRPATLREHPVSLPRPNGRGRSENMLRPRKAACTDVCSVIGIAAAIDCATSA
jgi:hypothetical protein